MRKSRFTETENDINWRRNVKRVRHLRPRIYNRFA